MAIQLITLPFASDALEPYIDKATVEIHHGKHQATYATNLNNLIAKAPALADKSLEQIMGNQFALVPDDIKTPVRNNSGGVYNHNVYWETLNPANKPAGPVGDIAAAINRDFGSYDAFKEKLTAAGLGRFGSGWAWLIKKAGKLEIVSTANQDSPLSDGFLPLIALDVWEHAYYLKYQNRRADYIAAFHSALNWRVVNERFAKA